jgi:hypothetical protein
VNAGEKASVSKERGEKKGSACEEECYKECESESNPKPRPKPSSADVAQRGVASIGVRSPGNLCVQEEYVPIIKLFAWEGDCVCVYYWST